MYLLSTSLKFLANGDNKVLLQQCAGVGTGRLVSGVSYRCIRVQILFDVDSYWSLNSRHVDDLFDSTSFFSLYVSR